MDFVSWLEALPAATVGKLYGSQWACQAVLRSLPSLAKQYVGQDALRRDSRFLPVSTDRRESAPLTLKDFTTSCSNFSKQG